MSANHAAALAVLDRITPGKWHVGGVNSMAQTTIRGEHGERVVLVDEQLGACGDYNARAIAALPELAALYRAGVEMRRCDRDATTIGTGEFGAAFRAFDAALAAVADKLGEGK